MTRRLIGCVVAVVLAVVTSARADKAPLVGPSASGPQPEMRSGGVLDTSFVYHRQAPAAAPHGNWYGYGFPVQTYRWGWFGAAHYYPTVIWHRGYNGDQCRWAYRRGY